MSQVIRKENDAGWELLFIISPNVSYTASERHINENELNQAISKKAKALVAQLCKIPADKFTATVGWDEMHGSEIYLSTTYPDLNEHEVFLAWEALLKRQAKSKKPKSMVM